MGKLEARAIIENTGNYDEEGVEEVMDAYDVLAKHIGWEDKRRDSRFIVKFHDIFWYTPNEWEEEHREEMNALFDDFCEEQYENITTNCFEGGIDIDSLLTKQTVGHYQAFIVDMPNITEENIAELAMAFYDEYNYEAKMKVEEQIYVVDLLQDLEDNYMQYWFNFLEYCEDVMPREIQQQAIQKYNEEMKYKKERKEK